MFDDINSTRIIAGLAIWAISMTTAIIWAWRPRVNGKAIYRWDRD